MIKKKIIGLATILAVMVSFLPVFETPAQAAKSVDIRAVREGDTSIRVDYESGAVGDGYTLSIKRGNNARFEEVETGEVEVSGNSYLQLPRRSHNLFNDLREGDVIQVKMTANTGGDLATVETVGVSRNTSSNYSSGDRAYGGRFDGDYYIDRNGNRYRWYEDAVGDRYYRDGGVRVYIDSYRYSGSTSSNLRSTNNGPWPPRTMAVTPDALKSGEANVLRITFDRDYSPSVGDKLEVISQDRSGTTINKQEVGLREQGYTVLVDVKPAANVASYQVVYKGAPGNTASLSQTIKVDGGTAVVPSVEFGVATELSIKYAQSTIKAGDQVAAPQVFLLDAKGNKKAPTEVTFTLSGDALDDAKKTTDGSFKVKDNAQNGQKVVVQAVGDRLEQSLSFVVGQEMVANDKIALVLESYKGESAKNNELSFQLKKGNEPYRLEWVPSVARVEFVQGADKAALVGAVTDLSAIRTSGKGIVSLKSDKAVQSSLRIILSDNKGNQITTESTSFRFDANANAGKHNVTMNIGSANAVVDGKVVQLDTTPVIKNNRTYVPYRGLAQSFGAEVKYDNATRKITTTLGGTSIVMTIDKTDYEVDGVVKKMDAAPFVNKDNRTMVPVRFVAEALGFSVTPLYYSNGATQGVIFAN